jgi:hypothetical protein
MSTIESRLATVERQLRFNRLVIAGLLVALVALVGYGATKGVPDVIRAKRFEVVNETGTDMADVDSYQGVGLFVVYNKDGDIGAEMDGVGTTDGGGGVYIFNKTGQKVVQAYADAYGMGYVGAFDRHGRGRTLTPR